jgi:hypothetical protein
MATWISVEGYTIEIRPTSAGHLIEREDIRTWVGAGFGVFYLDSDLLMIVDVAANARGANRNVRAMEFLRLSAFEPLTEIFGDVLIVRLDEVCLEKLISLG